MEISDEELDNNCHRHHRRRHHGHKITPENTINNTFWLLRSTILASIGSVTVCCEMTNIHEEATRAFFT